MPYDYKAIGDQIDALRGGGNEAQAWAMYNGLSGMGDASAAAGGVAGNLDSYLRTRWGDAAAKQWVNNNDTKYGNTLFDPKTGQWAGMGQAAGQGGQIAGWDASQYNAGGMGVGGAGYVPQGAGSGAAGFAGQTGVGVQGDGRTPFGQPTTGAGGAPPRQPTNGRVPTPTAEDYVRAGQPVPPGGAAGATGAPPLAGGGYVPPPAAAPYAAPTRTAAQQTPFDFMNDAGLQFRMGQGIDKIQGGAAGAGTLQSGATLKDLETFRQGLASEEYDKAFGRYTNQRDFGEDQFRDDRTFGRDMYRDDRDYSRGVYRDDRDYGEDQYKDRRDFGENSRRYEKDFGENSRRYDRDFGENARRYDQDFGERQYQDRRNFDVDEQRYNSDTDYRRSVDDYERRENARRYDQGFDYTARTGDRAFDRETLDTLNRTGVGAGGMNAESQATLARIISQLTTNSGQAGGQGGMGGSQNWLDLIASIFGQGAKRTP